MKKILVAIGILIFLAVVAFGIFIATFDADGYRPLVTSQIESALGSPVQLGRISLTWANGIALSVKELQVFRDRESLSQPVLSLEEARVSLELLPLLKKSIQIGSVTLIRPSVTLVRDAAGNVRILGLNPPSEQGPAAPAVPSTPVPQGTGSTPPAGASAPLSFFIGSLEVEDGMLRFSAPEANPPLDLALQDLDGRVRNLSLIQPFEFKAAAAFAGAKQNLTASGRFSIPSDVRPGVLEELRLAADLNNLQISDLVRAFPALGDLKLGEGLKGRLEVNVEKLVLDPHGLSRVAARVLLSDGQVIFGGMKSPLENLQGEVVIAGDRAGLKRLGAQFAGGTVSASGVLAALSTDPELTFQLSGEPLDLDGLQPAADPGAPRLRGKLSLGFQGQATGRTGSEMSRTFSGRGRILVAQGGISNFNMLREVFSRLSILPGLVQTLFSRLPPDYKVKLEAQDTVFEPVDLPLAAEGGIFYLNPLQIVSEDFILQGSVAVQLDGIYFGQGVIRVEPELSRAIIRSVNELQYLADGQGWLEIPVRIQGGAGEVHVFPDLIYVGQKLALTKAQEWIGGLFGKKEPPASQEPPSGTQAPAEEPQDQDSPQTPQDPLGALLGGLLKGSNQ